MSEKLLANAQRAGVYHVPASMRDAVGLAAKRGRLRQWHMAIAPGQKSGSVLHEIGKTLQFPEWYGANFDALRDCLTDPEIMPGTGHLLSISGGDHLRAADPAGFATLLEVLETAADERRQAGKPLWILFDEPVTGIRPLPAA